MKPTHYPRVRIALEVDGWWHGSPGGGEGPPFPAPAWAAADVAVGA